MTAISDSKSPAARRVSRIIKGMPATDGAGVELTRVIGQPALPMLDPFLLLDAFREVETALVAEGSLLRQELALQLSVDEAVEAQLLAEQRYRQGLEGIITLLDTQRRSFVAQVSLLRTRRLRLNNRIDLHLALGGAFAAKEL